MSIRAEAQSKKYFYFLKNLTTIKGERPDKKSLRLNTVSKLKNLHKWLQINRRVRAFQFIRRIENKLKKDSENEPEAVSKGSGRSEKGHKNDQVLKKVNVFMTFDQLTLFR